MNGFEVGDVVVERATGKRWVIDALIKTAVSFVVVRLIQEENQDSWDACYLHDLLTRFSPAPLDTWADKLILEDP